MSDMSYGAQDFKELGEFYRSQLLESTMPFWFPRSYDREHGGYLLMRDADGSLIDDDKAATKSTLVFAALAAEASSATTKKK